MGLLSWIFAGRRADKLSMKGLRAKEESDVAEPDAFPSADDLADRFARSNLFRPEAVDRFALGAAQFLRDGSTYREVVETIVGTGERVAPERVRTLGFPVGYVIGRDFLDGLATSDAVSAPGRLEDLIHLAASRAAQLHALRGYQEAEIRYVRLTSPRDARTTVLERRYDNRRITVAEAFDLVRSRGDEIRRSHFAAVPAVDDRPA